MDIPGLPATSLEMVYEMATSRPNRPPSGRSRASFDFRGDRRVYLVPTGANTQPALASYLSDGIGPAATPAGLFVLTVAGQKFPAITRFHLDEPYPRFGLAGSLSGPGA